MNLSSSEEQELNKRAQQGDQWAAHQLAELNNFRYQQQMEYLQHEQQRQQGGTATSGCVLYAVLTLVIAFAADWAMRQLGAGLGTLFGAEAAGGPQAWLIATAHLLTPLVAVVLAGDWLRNRGLNGRNPLRLLATASLWLVGLSLVAGTLALVL
jgi:hypothetical protein